MWNLKGVFMQVNLSRFRFPITRYCFPLCTQEYFSGFNKYSIQCDKCLRAKRLSGDKRVVESGMRDEFTIEQA